MMQFTKSKTQGPRRKRCCIPFSLQGELNKTRCRQLLFFLSFPNLGDLRYEDHEFQSSVGLRESFCSNKNSISQTCNDMPVISAIWGAEAGGWSYTARSRLRKTSTEKPHKSNSPQQCLALKNASRVRGSSAGLFPGTVSLRLQGPGNEVCDEGG